MPDRASYPFDLESILKHVTRLTGKTATTVQKASERSGRTAALAVDASLAARENSMPTTDPGMVIVAVATAHPETRDAILDALVGAGYVPDEAATGDDLLRIVFDHRPGVVILDMALPDVDPGALLRVLHAVLDVPIIALSGDASPHEVASALDLGAADVVGRAVSRIELIARLRAALKRRTPGARAPAPGRVVVTGDIEIDHGLREVRKGGVPVRLSETEFRLLDALAARAGQVVPRRFLLEQVWGDREGARPQRLRVYVGYLRRKLEDRPDEPEYIVTEWGLGYRLVLLPALRSGEETERRSSRGSES